MAQKLIRSRVMKPYIGTRSNLAFAKDKAGVYLIYNSGGNCVYVGYSETQLEKTILRHFQGWNDKTQQRVTYRDRDNMSVRVVLTTPGRAAQLEKALILTLKPKDNPDKLAHYTLTTAGNEILNEYTNAAPATISQMEDAPF